MSKLSIASFTNFGYRLHSRGFEAIDGDMRGKTVLITGATGGLGLATARALAGMGARVVIVGRNGPKLADAAGAVSGEVLTLKADLSLLAEVDRLAGEFTQVADRLDVLVNNVGVLNPERLVTSEGVEATLATNLAGHFLLTNRLAGLLAHSAPARVINVTSGGMYSEKIRPADLQFEQAEYRGTASYSRTKRAQVILTEMWAERFDGTGVVVHAMHPGWAKTAGVERSLPTFNRVMQPFLRTPEQGADTIVWLASAGGRAETDSGHLWFDRAVVPTHLTPSTVETPSDRDLLWSELVRMTRSDFPATIGEIA